MVRIGCIHFGGKTTQQYSGIAYVLSNPSQISKMYTISNNNESWEVEFAKGHSMVIARTSSALIKEKVLTTGFTVIQEALDYLSIQKQTHLFIKNPENECIALFEKNGKLVLQHNATSPFSVRVSVNIEVKDKDGNIKSPAPEKFPIWDSTLRYYRLSQISEDLSEAYRNLYLSFESLLNYIYPWQGGPEEKWLRNALNKINLAVDLAKIAPSGSCPINHIIQTQYKDIRVKLFHAKTNIILPHNELSPNVIYDAYRELLLLWHEVASKYLDVPKLSEGGITQAGFISMVSPFEKFTLVYTDDTSPPLASDTEVSPSGRPYYEFTNNKYLGAIGKFKAAYTGVIDLEGDEIPIPIYRICTMIEGKLAATSFIHGGLFVADVDIFESRQQIKAINRASTERVFKS